MREEIATREAMAMGLDKDDTVLRRRLRQKFEFLVEDAASAVAPTDADLEAWLRAHAARHRAGPRLAFRQVYLDPSRRGTTLQRDADRLLADLRKHGADAPVDTLGDRLMLPAEVELTEDREVARIFGERFGEAVLALPVGQWSGPVPSGFGVHLVLVRERVAGSLPGVAEVRPALARDFMADRRKRQIAPSTRSCSRSTRWWWRGGPPRRRRPPRARGRRDDAASPGGGGGGTPLRRHPSPCRRPRDTARLPRAHGDRGRDLRPSSGSGPREARSRS